MSDNELEITERMSVPLSEITISYARSGGPGGQNVNKVNSKALLRWSLTRNQTLPEGVKKRFAERYGGRITSEGEVLITSQIYREQKENAECCITRLREMILSVAYRPVERKDTVPTRASKTKRLESKSLQSKKKASRSSRGDY